jgi:hypothetical protein
VPTRHVEDLQGRQEEARHHVSAGWLRSHFEWSWALPASLAVDPAETAADVTPEVPTSVIYADHSRPVQSGNADQTSTAC